MRIGLIGDYDASVTAHQAIPLALQLAGRSLENCNVESVWLPTESLVEASDTRLSVFNGLWCVPASPYRSIAGALAGIRFARTNRVPFLGTCGGFQHALLEYARDVLGETRAEHAETAPTAAMPLIAPLACSLVEKQERVLLRQGSRIREIYGVDEVFEAYHCSYGLNRRYQDWLQNGQSQLSFTGHDLEGEIRVLELEKHPFFIATLFQPERSAFQGKPHPLIEAYLRACESG